MFLLDTSSALQELFVLLYALNEKIFFPHERYICNPVELSNKDCQTHLSFPVLLFPFLIFFWCYCTVTPVFVFTPKNFLHFSSISSSISLNHQDNTHPYLRSLTSLVFAPFESQSIDKTLSRLNLLFFSLRKSFILQIRPSIRVSHLNNFLGITGILFVFSFFPKVSLPPQGF